MTDVFLRINGYSISADSKSIYKRLIQLIKARNFDMEHLVPGLESIAGPSR